MTNTIQTAHAETLTNLPHRCHDCGATNRPLHLASSSTKDFLVCPCCGQHPDHQAENPNCPTCPTN